MRLLIDTQILIWFQLDHPALDQYTTKLLVNTANDIFVSDISLYEIAIKQTIGKLNDFRVDINDIIEVVHDWRVLLILMPNFVPWPFVQFYSITDDVSELTR